MDKKIKTVNINTNQEISLESLDTVSNATKKPEFKFSVLISVYIKEKPEYLKEALDSIINQTLMPDEIVLVKDGKLTKELDIIIQTYVEKYENLIKTIPLEKNAGLGIALQKGVLNCAYDIIARMDTDDIAHPERFEKQINFLINNPDIDIAGSYISEFDGNPENIYAYRQVPITHDEIYKFAKFRCPMNHMTVMFKKQSVVQSGNYKHFPNIEDYFLWGRMLNHGYRFANIPENLVNVRAGRVMLNRRAKLKYFFNIEYKIQTAFLDMKFINKYQFFRNIILKFLLRAIPAWFRTFIYNKFLRG